MMVFDFPLFHNIDTALLIVIVLVLVIIYLITLLNYLRLRSRAARLEEFERIVHERTKELEDLSATRDKFFSIIAHDLRTPFLTLQGYTDLLLEEFNSLSEKEKFDFVLQINQVIKRSYQMLENLLNWSQSKAGRMEFRPARINLNSLLNSILEVCCKTAELKNVKINKKFDHDIFINADEDLLNIAFRNLLQNAVKFSDRNGTVNIVCEMMKNETVICIEDEGIGMDEETLNGLFQLGKVKSRNGTEGERGTGLGLLLCKEFIDMHKGKIWVQSEQNKGSKFCISLPN